MRSGHFFKLDNSSRIYDNAIVYRYLPLSINLFDQDSSDLPKYPVYITINSEAVEIHFHGEVNKKYTHTLLFSLPFSTLSSGELTNQINAAHSGTFHYGNKYNLTQLKKTLSFANVNFNTLVKHNNSLPYSAILSDFLFDLEYSKIFQNSPQFHRMMAGFTANHIFNSLTAKFQYYYCRLEFKKDGGDKIFAFLLKEVEETWLSLIRNEFSMELFNSSTWFKDVETEYRNVLFWEKKSTFFNDFDNYSGFSGFTTVAFIVILYFAIFDQHHLIILPIYYAHWLVNVSYGVIGIVFFYRILENWRKDNRKAWINSLIKEHGSGGKREQNTYITYNKSILSVSQKWFVRRYDLNSSFKIIFLQHKLMESIGSIVKILVLNVLPRLAISLFSAWLLLTTSSEFWSLNLETSFLRATIITVFVFFLLLVFLSIELEGIANDISIFTRLTRGVHVFFRGYLYSLVIGFGVMAIISEPMINRNLDLSTKYIMYPLLSHEQEKEIAIEKKSDSSYKECNLDPSYYYALLNNVKPDKDNFMIFKPSIRHRSGFLNLCTMSIFPMMLMINAAFALFVGVFIQLIFEERSVTESL